MRLAESFESDDSVVWTIILRPDVSFSDGTPFEANAVVFNWDRFQDPANAAPFADTANTIDSMEVVGPLTLEVTLVAANTAFPDTIAQSPLNFIASPTALQAAGPEEFGAAPVGAGAFTVTEFDPETRIVYERNDDFYDGRPYLDGVVFNIIIDEDAGYNVVLAGDADLTISSSFEIISKAEKAGLGALHIVHDGGSCLCFNANIPPFDDIRARQAMAYAFDRQGLDDAVYGGESDVVDSLFTDGSAFHNPDISQVDPDREKAQELLDELAAEGKPLEFTLLAPAVRAIEVEWWIGQMQSFDHLSVEVDSLATAEFAQRVIAVDFQVSYMGKYWPDVDTGMAQYYVTGGSTNRNGYSNATVDDAFAELTATADPAERKRLVDVIQQEIIDDVDAVIFTRTPFAAVYQQRVHDLEVTLLRVPNFDKVWLS